MTRAVDITSVPLTAVEEQDLVGLEAAVDRGLATFVEVGNALAEINDKQLYRATHATFVDYAKDRFGLGKSHAYRVIAAARIVSELPSPIGENLVESQARTLVGLPADQAAAVLSSAIENAGGSPTAADITAARERVAPLMPEPLRKQRPLPDAYIELVWTITKTLESLERLHKDKRFASHRERLASSRLSDLHRARGTLHGLMCELDNDVANEAKARYEVLVANGWSDPDSLR